MLNAGICAVCRGSTVPGLHMMQRALALRPDSPTFHAHLGNMHLILGRLPEAESSFRAALRLGANDPAMISALALTIANQGRPDEALRVCDDALAITPKLPLLHARKGSILAALNRSSLAKASYETALSIDPDFGPAQQALNDLPPHG
jgi:Flp pilus assembly protein TadD